MNEAVHHEESYMEGLRQSLGITREETIIANRDKLQVRYATGYSDAAAAIRADKIGEFI